MSTAVNPSAAKTPNATNVSPSAEREFNDIPYGLGPVWEVVVGYSLIEAALWTAGDLRRFWSIATVIWIVGLIVYRGQSLRELGLDWTAPLHSLWVIPAAAMISGAMLFGGHLAGTLHPYVVNRGFFSAALGYLFWALQQELMLQSFFFNRLERALGSGKAVWVAAGLFALAHLPNPVLVPATLIGGFVFCKLFRRYRNIYTLVVAQTILGICLAAAVPNTVHHHMRVGIGYLTFSEVEVQTRLSRIPSKIKE
jgi:membrane protease YdiL (CAAX protease family)